MDSQDITPESLSGDAHMTSSDDNGTVSGVDSLSLEELNQSLGKTYPSKEAALKSLKDTFQFVGKRKEDIMSEITRSQSETLSRTNDVVEKVTRLERELWYRDNPQYADYRGLIEKLGGSPTDVVQSQEFKTVFEKAKGYDESQKLRTVLESSPRVAAARSTMEKATEALNKGNRAAVEELATKAVREAYDF